MENDLLKTVTSNEIPDEIWESIDNLRDLILQVCFAHDTPLRVGFAALQIAYMQTLCNSVPPERLKETAQVACKQIMLNVDKFLAQES